MHRRGGHDVTGHPTTQVVNQRQHPNPIGECLPNTSEVVLQELPPLHGKENANLAGRVSSVNIGRA